MDHHPAMIDCWKISVQNLAHCNSIDRFLLPDNVKSFAIGFRNGAVQLTISLADDLLSNLPSAIACGLQLAQQSLRTGSNVTLGDPEVQGLETLALLCSWYSCIIGVSFVDLMAAFGGDDLAGSSGRRRTSHALLLARNGG
jgi:hypothetical protein